MGFFKRLKKKLISGAKKVISKGKEKAKKIIGRAKPIARKVIEKGKGFIEKGKENIRRSVEQTKQKAKVIKDVGFREAAKRGAAEGEKLRAERTARGEKQKLIMGTVPIGGAGIGVGGARIIKEGIGLESYAARLNGNIPASTRTAIESFLKSTGRVTPLTSKELLVKGIGYSAEAMKRGKSWTTTAFGVTFAGWFAFELINSIGFGEFVKGQAAKSLGFTINKAVKLGEFDLAEEANEARIEVLEDAEKNGLLDYLKSMPVVESVFDIKKALEAQKKEAMIDGKLIEIEREKAETGKSDTDIWDEINEKNVQREIEKREREQVERERVQKFYEDIDDARDAEEKKERQELADFWNDHAEKKFARAREEREIVSKFYADAREEWAKRQEENQKSNLNFGLI